MDRSADMALPDAARVDIGDRSDSFRSRRFGIPGSAAPIGGEEVTQTPGGDGPPETASVPAGQARVAAAAPAAADKPDLSAAVAAAQDGDQEAFRVLYRDMQPRLLRYLRAMVGEDAEDVASEAWLHIARDLPGFSGDSDGFRGWAATIARHRATDHQRRHRRRPQPSATPIEDLADLAGGDDTAASAMDTVSTEAAIALIAELPRDQAEAVLLRVVMGLDAESAGKVLGKRAGAVRTATYRGLKRLAARLEKAAKAGDTPVGHSAHTLPSGKTDTTQAIGPPAPRRSEE
jgi:RNA polymerase sigma-70 factor, ECF subfamily